MHGNSSRLIAMLMILNLKDLNRKKKLNKRRNEVKYDEFNEYFDC